MLLPSQTAGSPAKKAAAPSEPYAAAGLSPAAREILSSKLGGGEATTQPKKAEAPAPKEQATDPQAGEFIDEPWH